MGKKAPSELGPKVWGAGCHRAERAATQPRQRISGRHGNDDGHGELRKKTTYLNNARRNNLPTNVNQTRVSKLDSCGDLVDAAPARVKSLVNFLIFIFDCGVLEGRESTVGQRRERRYRVAGS